MISAANRAAENSFHATDRPPGSGRRRGHRDPRVAGLARLRPAVGRPRARRRKCSASSRSHARRRGVKLPFTANTPYVNTIAVDEQTPVPGSREIERRIKSLVRWNAMAMVVRGQPGLATASAATSRRSPRRPRSTRSASTTSSAGADHARRRRPGLLPGPRLARHVRARVPRRPARRSSSSRTSAASCSRGGGLSSYPHPWLMPDFWEVPHGVDGPRPDHGDLPGALHPLPGGPRPQADAPSSKVWAFLGDGETDEPESLGAITLASREKLDNLIFVINCNLQRLDGPVRGNGKIIQELEARLPRRRLERHQGASGAATGTTLLARDNDGPAASARMARSSTASTRSTSVEAGAYIREHFFGKYPRAARSWSKHLSDEQLKKLRRRRPRPGEGLRRLQGGHRAPRASRR